jgi:hypothetical protein
MMKQTPKWERGYRSHGYWIGTKRYGWVGLPPPSQGGATANGYGWVVDSVPYVEGRTETLREAKKIVEREVAKRTTNE